jgi:large subunit ribosomal protein L22
MATTIREDGRAEVRAQARWVRMAPRKARLTVEHIRGRTVPEARTVLAFTERAAAREVEKVLRSAVANAEANHGLIGDEMIVETAVVDEGPTMKRFRARARGRAARIRKRTCHITLTLTTLEAVPADRQRHLLPRRSREAEPLEEVTEVPEVEEIDETEVEEAPVAEAETPAEPRGEAEEKPKRPRRRKKDEKEEETDS